MNRRNTLLVFFLLITQLGLMFYVFNSTIRDRTSTFTLQSEETMSCFNISNWGDYLAIGTENGTISYYSTRQTVPQWVYKGDFGILSLLMSEKGDYVLSLDENYTLSLFRSLSENKTKWTYDLDEGDIVGLHSSGGLPTVVYMLATRAGSILLFSNQDGLIWEYSTGTDRVIADISFDGKYVVAVDGEGMVYLFDLRSSQPVWVSSTGLNDAVIALSYTSRIAVGGSDSSKGGRIYSLSLEDGERVWDWNVSSPVNSLSISSDGISITAHENEGQTSVLTYSNEEVIYREIKHSGDIKSAQSPPFGSYVLTTTSEGKVYFFFTLRQTPLWVYNTGKNRVKTALSSTGDKVFISDGNRLALITNSAETGIIPGSRTLWGVCFLTGLVGLSFIYYMSSENFDLFKNMRAGYKEIFSGLIIGAIIGIILQRGVLGIFVAAVSSATGSYFGFYKEGLGGFIYGFFASIISAFSVSIVYGLFDWFSGVEYNILFLIISSVSNGTQFGFIFGLLGTSFGLLKLRYGTSD